MKILYLPTGEYITFQGIKGFTTILDIKTLESYGFKELTNDEIIKKLTETTDFDIFAKRNNLIFPIIKEHFEVVL
ncbi:MAG: hypothetical protein JHC33_15095 [Ignisphaera sp.]|nr:hypothetical protein [Ignisphaera sp.]